MIGRINSPRKWPADAPATPEQLRQIDKTLAFYGPGSDPRVIPAKDNRDDMRLALRLDNAKALAASEPMNIRALL